MPGGRFGIDITFPIEYPFKSPTVSCRRPLSVVVFGGDGDQGGRQVMRQKQGQTCQADLGSLLTLELTTFLIPLETHSALSTARPPL